LAVHIGLGDVIEVDQRDPSDATACQGLGAPRADPANPGDDHMPAAQSLGAARPVETFKPAEPATRIDETLIIHREPILAALQCRDHKSTTFAFPRNVNTTATLPSTPPPTSFRLLTEAEREASLQAAMDQLSPNQDIWIFGYGSLIWRPEFEFAERRHALLHGYHRALCLWSRVNRGTPDKPGLVFGLDAGGSCRGVAFRIPQEESPQMMEALWRREMTSGAYIPRWLTCRTDKGAVTALAFTMNRNTDAYVRDLPQEHLLHIVRNAHGSYGPCIDYVLETADALMRHNIVDKRLSALARNLLQA